MMRSLAVTASLLVSVVALTGCSKSAGHSADTPGATSASIPDDQNLEGTWKMQRAVLNGQPLMNDVRWTFDGDTLTIVLGGNQEGGVRSHFELGTGGRPDTILIKQFNNPLAAQGYSGGSYTGIFKMTGDRLRVTYDMTGRQYPTNFDAGKGLMRMAYEFKREATQ